MKDLDLPRAQDLPAWMETLRDRYLHTETSQFILHGNVHDVLFVGGRVWSMPEFLDAFFAPSEKVVVHFDPGRGVYFADDEQAARAARVLVKSGFLDAKNGAGRGERGAGRSFAALIRAEVEHERDPAVVLPLLEALLVEPELPCAVVVHYAELIAPDGGATHLSFDDRTAAATIHRWSLSRDIVEEAKDNVVLLLTASLTELARLISRNPRVGSLQVPLPSPIERARFLAHHLPDLDPDRGEKLTRVSAGLQLRQIKDVLNLGARSSGTPVDGGPRAVFQQGKPLPLEAVAERKTEILEQECYGLIEVIEPEHDFSVVGGNEHIKATLERIAGHVKAGRRAQVPMGILFVGPMGTGKSFVAEAFARESGLPAIKLKNFRDKWVGSTEANLEKVLQVIEGLGDILVMIDEGDRSIGGGSGEGDGGVNSRVIARLKEFMSDSTHRGRIIFVMMTNRPDKLDADMKRAGRFDLKIPFFPPQDAAERVEILRAVARRHRIELELEDGGLEPIVEGLDGASAADLEALVLMANDDLLSGVLPEGIDEAPSVITPPFLAAAVRDFLPSRDREMVEYMSMLAIHEASSRRLLPPRYRDIDLEDLAARLASARSRALRH